MHLHVDIRLTKHTARCIANIRKLWTVMQYINMTRVSPQYRVIFGNFVSLFWSIYVASTSTS